MPSALLNLLTQSDGVGRGMPLSLLDGKHDRTMSVVECHHLLWAAHTVEQSWACYDIIAFAQHKRSNHIECGMPSPPLDNIHG